MNLRAGSFHHRRLGPATDRLVLEYLPASSKMDHEFRTISGNGHRKLQLCSQ